MVATALEAGGTLGGYRILARLRAGAMGVLYLARRDITGGGTAFARPVAIKVIHDHLATNKRFVRMFIDEAKLCARIDDPNVVRVEEFGEIGGRYYLVMEYVHGVSLGQAMSVTKKSGGIPIPHAVQLAIQIAGGLHGAHEATADDGTSLGIVHRDVSPTNVLVSYKGYVRVIDFGIARAKQVGGQTKTGSLRGKLAYMPPEQARSARTVDRRADLYALGLILWEMLTQRRVFDAETDIAILNQIREPNIVPPSTFANVPRALDAVVMKMLEQDPERRQKTGAQLQRELADAVPEALRIMPVDLAALMTKVRSVAAEAAKTRGVADEEAEEGAEVVRTLALFGSNLNESVEGAGDGGAGVLDTRPSSPDIEPPAVVDATDSDPTAAAFVQEDATTALARQKQTQQLEQKRTIRTSSSPLRPSDGVRPLGGYTPAAVPLPPGSSPDMLIPPPATSSSRALIPTANTSSHDLMDAVVKARRTPEALPATVVPTDAVVVTTKQKLALIVGVPIACAFVIALAIVFTAGDKPPPAAAAPPPKPKPSTVPLAGPPPVPVPVVIAPTDPSIDAGEIDVKPVKPGKKSGGATSAAAKGP